MKAIRLSLSLIVFLFIQTTARTQSSTQEKIKQAERNLVGTIQIAGDAPKTIQQRMADTQTKGLSLAVIENYRVVWAKGYGWADDSLKVPVTTQTLFQAASISKSLNSVGVLKLVQEKKLSLYSDINTYLANWKFPYDSVSKGKKISVANLLSHTGALTVHGFGGYEQGSPIPSLAQILDGKTPANSQAVRSKYEPGTKSEYSGGGITISQLIVTDITHERYADHMKKSVLTPLGMTLSTFSQPPVDVKPSLLASGYTGEGKRLTGKYHIYPEEAAAGLWTNPTELAKYIIETQLAYQGRS
ncbi:MAG: serine hydrolase [Segetibacter sp.]|nr:serine hydrolase [Segetibacter sp.]